MTSAQNHCLTKAFWRKYRHLVVITPAGSIRLTAPGRMRFAHALAAHGYNPGRPLNRTLFEMATALHPTELPVQTEEDLAKRLSHNRLTPYERSLLAQVLSQPLPEVDNLRAPVVPLNAWRVDRAA